jgi:hypothetical protein
VLPNPDNSSAYDSVSEHGYDEFADDDILAIDVIGGAAGAVVVEDCPQFGKGPSVLVLQKDASDRPIHVLWGIPKGRSEPAVVVTLFDLILPAGRTIP